MCCSLRPFAEATAQYPLPDNLYRDRIVSVNNISSGPTHRHLFLVYCNAVVQSLVYRRTLPLISYGKQKGRKPAIIKCNADIKISMLLYPT